MRLLSLLLLLVSLLFGAGPARASDRPAPDAEQIVLGDWQGWELRQAYRHTRTTALFGAVGIIAGPGALIGGVVLMQTCPLGCRRGQAQLLTSGMVTAGGFWLVAAVPLLAVGTLQGASVLGEAGITVPRTAGIASITLFTLSALCMLGGTVPFLAVAALGALASIGTGVAQLAVNDRWARRGLGWRALRKNPFPEISPYPLLNRREVGMGVTGRF